MERAGSQFSPRMDSRIQIWGMVHAAIVPIASVVVALVVGAAIIALSGANPLVAYSALFEGGLGSGR
ncbi:MAG: ABC transporter permease, partial [Roseiflexus sp.]|nr:ABC transporter permease [Roseiflexus sp.]